MASDKSCVKSICWAHDNSTCRQGSRRHIAGCVQSVLSSRGNKSQFFLCQNKGPKAKTITDHTYPYHPCVIYSAIYIYLMFMVNVGKYTFPSHGFSYGYFFATDCLLKLVGWKGEIWPPSRKDVSLGNEMMATWRIIPVDGSVVGITTIYKPWSSVYWKKSHNPILRGFTNNGYKPLTKWDDPPSSQPTPPHPLTYPPQKSPALWSGLINHWFPLIRVR